MKQTEIFTRVALVKRLVPSRFGNFRLLHVSNLSVRNFRIFLLMYPGTMRPTVSDRVAPRWVVTLAEPDAAARFRSLPPLSGPVCGGDPNQRAVSQPVSQPASQPASRPVSQPASQPANQPANQPTSQPANQPASQLAGQSASQPASRPVSQPAG